MSELIPNPQPGPGRWSTAPQGPFAPVDIDIDAAHPPGFVVRYESFADPSGASVEPAAEPVALEEPMPDEEDGAEGVEEAPPKTAGSRGRIRAITVATARTLLALSWAIGRASYQHPRWALVVLLSIVVLGATAMTRPSKSTPPASIAAKKSEEPPKTDDSPAKPEGKKEREPGPEDPTLAQTASTSEPESEEKKVEPTEPEPKEPGGPLPTEATASIAEAAPKLPKIEEEPTNAAVPVATVLTAEEKPSAPSSAPPPETDPAITSPLADTSAAPAPAPAPTTPATAPAVPAPAPTTPATADANTDHPAMPLGVPRESSTLLPLPVVGEKPLTDPATTAAATQPSVAPKPDAGLPKVETPGNTPPTLSSEKLGPSTPIAAGTEPGPLKDQPTPGPETAPGDLASPPLSPVATPTPEPATPAGPPSADPTPASGPAIMPPSGLALPSVTPPQPASPDAPEKPPAPTPTPKPDPIEKSAKDRPDPPAQFPTPAEKKPQVTVPSDEMPAPADTSPTFPTFSSVEERPVNPDASRDSGGKNRAVPPGLADLPSPAPNVPSPGPEIPTGPADSGPVAPKVAPAPAAPRTNRDEERSDPSPQKLGDPQPAPPKPTVEAPAANIQSIEEPKHEIEAPAARTPPEDEPKHEIEAPATKFQPKENPGQEKIEAQPAVASGSAEPAKTNAPSVGENSPEPVMVSPTPAPVSKIPEKLATPPQKVTVHQSDESRSEAAADQDLAGSGWVRIASKGHLSPEMIGNRSGPFAGERGELDSSAGLRSRAEGPTTVSAPDRLEAAGVPTDARLVPKDRETSLEPAAGHPAEKPRVDSTIHVVERGENFWTISRLYYGSARYYRALWKANSRKYPNIEQIHINDVIQIPAVENLDPAYIGRPERAPIAHQERDRVPDQNPGLDPDRSDSVPTSRTTRTPNDRLSARRPVRSAPELELPVGDLEPDDWPTRIGRTETFDPLRTEGNNAYMAGRTRREFSADRPVYKVRDYDTLRSIARDLLGDPHRSEEIYELNRDVIEDPTRLATGTLLELPEDADVRRITVDDRTRGHR